MGVFVVYWACALQLRRTGFFFCWYRTKLAIIISSSPGNVSSLFILCSNQFFTQQLLFISLFSSSMSNMFSLVGRRSRVLTSTRPSAIRYYSTVDSEPPRKSNKWLIVGTTALLGAVAYRYIEAQRRETERANAGELVWTDWAEWSKKKKSRQID